MSSFDHLFKVVLLGNADSGKSRIINSFVDNYDENFISTLGVDFKVRSVTVEGKIVKLQIWDTSNQDRYKPVTSVYYRGASGFIIVYNNSIRSTFEEVRHWLDEIDLHASADVCRFLVSHKISNDNENNPGVSTEEGEALARQLEFHSKKFVADQNKILMNFLLI